MDPYIKITKNFTKKFGSKVINIQDFLWKTGLKFCTMTSFQVSRPLRPFEAIFSGPNHYSNISLVVVFHGAQSILRIYIFAKEICFKTFSTFTKLYSLKNVLGKAQNIQNKNSYIIIQRWLPSSKELNTCEPTTVQPFHLDIITKEGLTTDCGRK